jgi:queuine tRNA-ribosyltransferase
MLFTGEGIINMKNEKWKNDHSPLDPEGVSFVDQAYTRAFVRHLFNAGEMLGPMIATVHNLGFYLNLMKQAREKIREGNYAAWKNIMVKKLQQRI